jgi:hypothetical protein
MKLVHEEILINEGDFTGTNDYSGLHAEILEGLKAVVWPGGSESFRIRPRTKEDKHPNGVLPIKARFVEALRARGWKIEEPLQIAVREKPGPLDAVKLVQGKYYAVEWETGNISSSHRALNKMAIGIGAGVLWGGTLIVPSRSLYRHLTDRIGNYEELVPYFPMYKMMKPEAGVLTIMAVEHDELDSAVPKIPKGTDGYGLGLDDGEGPSIRELKRLYGKSRDE